MLLEVCVDSVQSAVNAEKGGAKRLELCANLAEGGTTPSLGMLKIIKQLVTLPVFVMIRPRGGDFLYSEQELAVMREDIKALKETGADGFVLGVLTSAGLVDIDRCQELIAIDMTCDVPEALEDVIRLGCERVLTSGGEISCLEGAPIIRRLTEQAGSRIIVVPGGGITERNLRRILDETGCQEFHASARASQPSEMLYKNTPVSMGAKYGPSEFLLKVTDRDLVRGLIQASKGAA